MAVDAPSPPAPPAGERERHRLALAPCPTAAVARLEAELGVSNAVAQVLVRRGFGDPDEARAWLAAGDVHQRAWPGDQVLVVVDAEADLPVDDIESFVPGMAVGRGAAAFRPVLAEDFVAAGLLVEPSRQDRRLGARGGVQCAPRQHTQK